MEISWYEISDPLREGWRTEESDWEGAYSAPDMASMRRTVWIKEPGWPEHDVDVLETVYVGDKVYRRQVGDTGWRVEDTSPVDEGWLLATTNPIWAVFDSLTGVEQLPTENINGIECLHYRGRADMDAYIDKLSDIDFVSDMEEEWLRHMDKTVEIWIGQNDYLIRKYEVNERNPYSMPNAEALSTPAGSEFRYTSRGVTKFYDYNEAVQIEAPM
jgi:hypothetical protein